MKVLENWMVQLDLLPGSSSAELQSQAQAQLGEKGEQVQAQIKEQAASIFSKLPEDQQGLLKQGLDKISPEQKASLQESIMSQLPKEQQAQAKSYLQQAASVGTGTLGTVGKGVGGVVDTLGNTVGALAGGLAQTGQGVYGGAKDTVGLGEKKKGGLTAEDLEGVAKDGGAKEEGKEEKRP